ncbi:hypothetical protein GGF50DRAFT_105097, partial [Schizophyllum commune]
LLYYDYTLTFADEKKLIWGRKLGLTTLLYVLCRYALVANSCDAAYRGISSLSVLGRAAVLTTWATRTWVVWNRNSFIVVFLGALVATCTALDCYQASGARCTGPASHQEWVILDAIARSTLR